MRPWYLRWGASPEECAKALPGDELVRRADLVATRAITIRARRERIWPWLAQMGQGRGGLYSYDALENLVGCDMHSADRVVPEWQDVAPGDAFRLHPDVALEVTAVEPDRALVIRGGVPMGDAAPPYDFTWAFVLEDVEPVRGRRAATGSPPQRISVRRRHSAPGARALRLHTPVGASAGRAGRGGQFRDEQQDAAWDQGARGRLAAVSVAGEATARDRHDTDPRLRSRPPAAGCSRRSAGSSP